MISFAFLCGEWLEGKDAKLSLAFNRRLILRGDWTLPRAMKYHWLLL